ncbi:MAG: hypothetical protein KGQ36_06220 [Rickettsiales bacterium]|nr:hypothetical protein [Rickettsiales bacterium]
MNKGIVVKLVVLLAIIASAHSVFWFFKAGQVEKQIQNFISENSSYISAGEVAVSGFPLSQTVKIQDLKFVIPNAAFNKYQTTVKTLEAHASIFSSDFTVTTVDQVTVQDLEGTNVSNVEFVKSPEVQITLSSDMVAKFTYKDSGYRILDADKVVTYVAASSSVSFESMKEEGDKIKNKLMINVTDIEGFDVVSIYKNAVEGKIIDGIKTGEIAIGNSASGLVATDSSQVPATQVVAANTDAAASASASPVAVVANADASASAANPAAATAQNNVVAPVVNNAPVAQNPAAAAPTDSAAVVPAVTADGVAVAADPNAVTENAAPVENQPIKASLVLDMEYELVPSSPDQQSQAAMDPTQVQENSGHYNKVVKINNFEFSNSSYKVTVNGQLEIFQDDTMPSGAVTVKVEKLDGLVTKLIEGLNKSNVLSQAALAPVAPETVAATTDTTAVAAAAPATIDAQAGDNASSAAAIDPYQNFLKRLSANMSAVTKEVAQKSQLSTPEASTFEVRREKNLEILVNETPIREVLGKL